jgi:hypothetical protein
MQLIETKMAGACGALGIIHQVSGGNNSRATLIMSYFAGSLGLDAPIEVVNQAELDFLLQNQVTMVTIHCGVGFFAQVPGLALQVAQGILKNVPFTCASIVGVKTLAQAQIAAEGGASAVLLKAEMLAEVADDIVPCRDMLHGIECAVNGD